MVSKHASSRSKGGGSKEVLNFFVWVCPCKACSCFASRLHDVVWGKSDGGIRPRRSYSEYDRLRDVGCGRESRVGCRFVRLGGSRERVEMVMKCCFVRR